MLLSILQVFHKGYSYTNKRYANEISQNIEMQFPSRYLKITSKDWTHL